MMGRGIAHHLQIVGGVLVVRGYVNGDQAKNKSAWRKTDIQDVEQFLEDQRQEERIG